jgi:putative toxin-antitoxin system antitoxin component (TIGR02293 family)
MSQRTGASELPHENADIEHVGRLLGGARVLRHRLAHQLDVHEFLDEGLPRAALTHLYERFRLLRRQEIFERALGMSLRTFQRLKLAPRKPLSREQSGRTWQLAEILAKAIDVFGSQDDAEAWLDRPAIALEQRRPVDLLATPPGVRLVEDLLGRIEYGVYT